MKQSRIALKYGDEVFQIAQYRGAPVIGYNQEWYPTKWQQTSGCGPTAACNIMAYMLYASGAGHRIEAGNQSACVSAMEEAWAHVTPGDEGMPSTDMFRDGFLRYANDRGFRVCDHVLNVSGSPAGRPSFETVRSFVEQGLRSDAPVAFLNLCNGDVCNLDRWHWVTIVSLACEPDGGKAVVTVLDEGHVKTIDLRLWTDTTVRGGGLVYFTY